ncbi:PASTA domain-containing protein [Jatrophihabitans endophyticus]|uniref:PASTA domain-containing protein n=1 Tax=Jatrophihabitans endophyticus TaxID=1206085 RepID=UPI00116136FD|nr:PASTA domain-containing protein [Jatrophihabitans endophyticus]
MSAGLAASLGAGYTVAHAALQDGSAYVTKGSTVSHVNGESRTLDATSRAALATSGEALRVRAVPGDKVVAVNQKTGVVTTVDGGTMTPTATVRPKRATVTEPSDVVSSGKGAWLVDYDGSAVRPLEQGVARAPVAVAGRPDDAAPGPAGSLFVLTREGTLVRVDRDRSVHRVDVDNARNGSLTVAGSQAYLVTTVGDVVALDGTSGRRVAAVQGAAPGSDGHVLVGSSQGSGEHVLVVSSRLLAIVDPRTGGVGDLVTLPTADHRLGRPVEYRGKVYVPDYAAHKLVVVDVATKRVERTQLTVPGTQPTFDLFVAGGKLWANDQYAQRLVQLDDTGQHRVDKGPGNGVQDDTRKPPPTRSPQSPTSTTPPAGTPPSRSGGSSSPTRDRGGEGRRGKDRTNPPSRGGGSTAPRYVQVPHFPDGVYRDVACSQLADLGLRCSAVSREVTVKDSDTVVETSPRAGAKVAEGSTVTVIYVGKPAVPDVANDTPADACHAIELAGLRCRTTADTPAEQIEDFGAVTGTDPPSGQQVATNSTVAVRYRGSFRMPDFSGTKGTKACDRLRELSLQLPDRQPVTVECTTKDGDPAPKSEPDAANEVYEQKPAGNATFTPGSGHRVSLTVHTADADLADYTLRRGGYPNDAQTAVEECAQRFRCVLSDQRVPAVDGGAHPDWVGKVAAMQDGNGNDRQPGRYQVGDATTVVIVAYGDQAQVPNVVGQQPSQGCQAVQSAGFECRLEYQPNRVAQVNGQSPQGGATAGINTTVTLYQSDKPTVVLNKYHRTTGSGTGVVRILVAEGDPVPPNYALDGPVGSVYRAGSYSPDWPLKEFTNTGTCSGYQNNILYSHGAPAGCMSQANTRNAGDVLPPDGDTCSWGTVWLFRISNKIDNDTIQFDIVRGTTKKSDVPGTSYDEPLGCVYPPQ